MLLRIASVVPTTQHQLHFSSGSDLAFDTLLSKAEESVTVCLKELLAFLLTCLTEHLRHI